MELKDFVKSVIVEIVNGIKEANDSLKGTGAIINPANVYPATNNNVILYGHITEEREKMKARAVHKIDFDVAVIASEGKETKGGIGIAIATIGLGSSGKSEASQSTNSRIQFSIPIAYPEFKSSKQLEV